MIVTASTFRRAIIRARLARCASWKRRRERRAEWAQFRAWLAPLLPYLRRSSRPALTLVE